jgi:peptidoglycan/LPS O-acetylase OafA/YrhL
MKPTEPSSAETRPAASHGYYYELDSLRGLAALTVLVAHILGTMRVFEAPLNGPMPFAVYLVRFTPLGFINAGTAAVIFFFVLSGFVLALPFLKREAVLPYLPFIIKRVCRIYPAYWASLAFAILMNALCYRGPVPGLSRWFGTFGEPHIDWHSAFQHVFLINSFDYNKFNIVIWSLMIEMRLSLVFPLIMYFVLKFGWRVNLLGGMLGSMIGWGCHFLAYKGVIQHENTYGNTFLYLPMFIVGALLAKHRDWLKQKFLGLSRTARWAFFCLALLAYTNACWLPQLFPWPAWQKTFSLGISKDWIATAAVASFIVMALASKKISRILLLKPLHFVGKISYSFYLFHVLILFGLLHLCYGLLPFPVIVAMVVIASFVLAAISYRWIEIPFIRLGKHLAKGG